jgi:hypothetical protein
VVLGGTPIKQTTAAIRTILSGRLTIVILTLHRQAASTAAQDVLRYRAVSDMSGFVPDQLFSAGKGLRGFSVFGCGQWLD